VLERGARPRGPPARELGDLVGVHVEAEDGEAVLDEGEGEREADVAHADDADEGVMGLDLGEERGGERVVGHGVSGGAKEGEEVKR
jgi:hypothetical protein